MANVNKRHLTVNSNGEIISSGYVPLADKLAGYLERLITTKEELCVLVSKQRKYLSKKRERQIEYYKELIAFLEGEVGFLNTVLGCFNGNFPSMSQMTPRHWDAYADEMAYRTDEIIKQTEETKYKIEQLEESMANDKKAADTSKDKTQTQPFPACSKCKVGHICTGRTSGIQPFYCPLDEDGNSRYPQPLEETVPSESAIAELTKDLNTFLN